MIRACEKRPVAMSTLMKLADEIEQELQNSLDRETSTKRSGNW